MDFPSPPVPAKLREMIKDYPEHIEQLQKALISVSHGRQSYAPPLRPQYGYWRTVSQVVSPKRELN